MQVRDVVIAGSGPSGLAAAIAASRRGLDYQVLEKGVLTNSIYRFPRHMVFFTTPELLEIGGLPFVTPYEKPTRYEALRYYRRVADTYRVRIAFGEQVRAIRAGDVGTGAGRVLTIETRAEDGGEREYRARAVVLAIGSYDHPNRLGVPGEDLPHVSHYYSEAHPCYRKRVVVVGGRNSAAEAALELYRAGARVTLVHRGAALSDTIKYWVLPDIQNRIKDGSIAGRFGTRVLEIRHEAVIIEREGVREELPADVVFLLTGYHPDHELFRRVGIAIDSATCMPVHDPETLETNVPNVFVIGGAISGRETAPIFIENGRLHGEKVVQVIAGRLGHAQRRTENVKRRT
jgi:thioredoxin reductase (NADPH)